MSGLVTRRSALVLAAAAAWQPGSNRVAQAR
jgi:hypothetical protein